MFSPENNNVKRCKTDGRNQRNPDVVYSQNITGQKNKCLIQFLSAALLVQSETRSPESRVHSRETEHGAAEGRGRHAAQRVDVPVTFPVLNRTTHNVLLEHTKRREAPAGDRVKSCSAATGEPPCCWTESTRGSMKHKAALRTRLNAGTGRITVSRHELLQNFGFCVWAHQSPASVCVLSAVIVCVKWTVCCCCSGFLQASGQPRERLPSVQRPPPVPPAVHTKTLVLL